MPDPLGFFLTWTTYGTWLPGDERGWVRRGKGFQAPNGRRRQKAAAKLVENPVRLDDVQRRTVETTIAEHCASRGWVLHIRRCRTNHVHVVVTADCAPRQVREQLKAWCTRKLKELVETRGGVQADKRKWWTDRGSCRRLMDEASLEAAIIYLRDFQ